MRSDTLIHTSVCPTSAVVRKQPWTWRAWIGRCAVWLFAGLLGASFAQAQQDNRNSLDLVFSGQITAPSCQVIPVVNDGQAVRLPRLPYDPNVGNSVSSTALFSIVLKDSASSQECGQANQIASIQFDPGPGHEAMLDLLKPQLRNGLLKNTYLELLIFSHDWSQSQVVDMRSRAPVSTLSAPGWANAPKDSKGKLNLGIRLSRNLAPAEAQAADQAAYGSFYIALPFVIALN